jgi:hypothetical protein
VLSRRKDGANPKSGPLLTADGKLFAETRAGGRYGPGTAFEIAP